MNHDERTRIMSLAREYDLNADYDPQFECVWVRMHWEDDDEERIPVYDYREMSDLVGG